MYISFTFKQQLTTAIPFYYYWAIKIQYCKYIVQQTTTYLRHAISSKIRDKFDYWLALWHFAMGASISIYKCYQIMTKDIGDYF